MGKKCDCLQIKEFGLKWFGLRRPSRTYSNLVYFLKNLERVLIQKKMGKQQKEQVLW